MTPYRTIEPTYFFAVLASGSGCGVATSGGGASEGGTNSSFQVRTRLGVYKQKHSPDPLAHASILQQGAKVTFVLLTRHFHDGAFLFMQCGSDGWRVLFFGPKRVYDGGWVESSWLVKGG